MKAKCVEFSAVFDDGTVRRWEGPKAERVRLAGDWSWLDPDEQPTVTTPMRKVTTTKGYIGTRVPCDITDVKDEPLPFEWCTIQRCVPVEAMTPKDAERRVCDYRIVLFR
jgi:hypothetical protein